MSAPSRNKGVHSGLAYYVFIYIHTEFPKNIFGKKWKNKSETLVQGYQTPFSISIFETFSEIFDN